MDDLQEQFQELASGAAELRQSWFSRDATGNPQMGRMEEGGDPFRCYFTPVRTQSQLDTAGFRDIHETIVRVAKTVEAFPLAPIGKKLRLIAAKPGGVDLVVVINELGHSGVNPEHVLGCKNI